MRATRFGFLILSFTLLAVGCSGSAGGAKMQLRSVDSARSFSETFPQAFYSQSDDGDRVVVLINDGLPRETGASVGPVKPIQNVPLRQVVRFKILWNPLHGTRIDAPSTTNCVIDWVIREAGPNPGADSLRYQGAGFVITRANDSGLGITVRSATLDAAARSGNLADPIGRCILSGKFTAVHDDQVVEATTRRMDQLPLSRNTMPSSDAMARSSSVRPGPAEPALSGPGQSEPN